MAGPEVAIFLDAGASCSEGAPTQSSLFSDFFSESFEGYRGLPSGHPSLQKIKVLKNSLIGFFEQFFGFDPTNPSPDAQFPTFEEALGLIDLALARDESSRHFEGNLTHQQWGATLRNIRTDFVFLIALILDKKLEHSKVKHRLLVQNLLNGCLLDRCAFVSFNYDILIDNALEEHDDRFLDYGIQFENVGSQTENQPFTSLFKLHGSLNWLTVPRVGRAQLQNSKKG